MVKSANTGATACLITISTGITTTAKAFHTVTTGTVFLVPMAGRNPAVGLGCQYRLGREVEVQEEEYEHVG